MSGAYTAKPDAESTPDIPPGWNPIWPFPGPFPPGYAPSYSGILTAPAYITPSSPTATAEISFLIVDQEEYKTNEPENNSIIWESDTGYEGGATGNYSEDDDGFWGDNGTFIFQNISPGDFITIIVTSYPFGGDWPIEGSAIIEVISHDDERSRWKIKLTHSESLQASSGESGQAQSYVYLEITGNDGYATFLERKAPAGLEGPDESCLEYDSNGSGYSSGENLIQKLDIPIDGIYNLDLIFYAWAIGSGSASCSGSYTLEIYENDTLQYSATHSISLGFIEYEEHFYVISISEDGVLAVDYSVDIW